MSRGIKRSYSKIEVSTEDEPALVAEPPSKRLKRSFSSPSLSEAEYEPTHKVVAGHCKGFEAFVESDGPVDGDMVVVWLVTNARRKKMRRPIKMKLQKGLLEGLDHGDMLKFAATLHEEEDEDPAFLDAERATWECPNCHTANQGDESSCTNTINGIPCGARRIALQSGPIGWGDCFLSIPQVRLVVYNSNTFTACCATDRHFFSHLFFCLSLFQL
jgi:hypothetical protein